MADGTSKIEATPDAARDGTPLPAPAAKTLLSPDPPEFANKATDLSALWNVVVDAASVGAGLWFSYLFVLFYFGIAVGGVTHRDIFYETPAKLPFLNVDLPLVWFFMIGPALILVVHAYVLLHVAWLGIKIGKFETELNNQITDEHLQD